MKSPFLFVLIACLSGPALADSVSEIEQIGAQHVAQMQQTSDIGTVNRSKIQQDGADHHAAVTQQGFIAQNVSEIVQHGTGNDAKVTQSADVAFDSTSVIQQAGSGNSAEVFQGASSELTLDVNIRQQGDGNHASVEQSGIFAARYAATIDQLGEQNDATVFQGNGSFSVSETVIRQVGSANTANASRIGSNTFGTAEIRQNGSGNDADVQQNWAAIMEVLVVQTGQLNEASIEQSGFEPASMTASVDQNGSGNRVTTRQISPVQSYILGAAATSSVTQIGSDNIAQIDQFLNVEGDLDISDVRMNGASNSVTLRQGEGSANSNNQSTMDVTGAGNSAVVTQSGLWGSNVSSLVETGNDNVVSVAQHAVGGGFGNTVSNTSSVNVAGDNNVVNVVQSVGP